MRRSTRTTAAGSGSRRAGSAAGVWLRAGAADAGSGPPAQDLTAGAARVDAVAAAWVGGAGQSPRSKPHPARSARSGLRCRLGRLRGAVAGQVMLSDCELLGLPELTSHLKWVWLHAGAYTCLNRVYIWKPEVGTSGTFRYNITFDIISF
jgi:hypothetical protein